MADSMKTSSSCGKILITYGTSTGTARQVAQRVAREAFSFIDGDSGLRVFSPLVKNLKDVSVAYLRENFGNDNSVVIFVVSTTGQGAFPEDSKGLWHELSKSEQTELKIRYAVIGLGDSSYEYFNYPAKKFDRRLEGLKGIQLLPVCLCDDQNDLGYLGMLNPFLTRFWAEYFQSGSNVIRSTRPEARFILKSAGTEGESETSEKASAMKTLHLPSVKMEKRTVIKNERATSDDHFQDTRVIAFDTLDSNFSFNPGDTLNIYPENFPTNVELFFQIFPRLKKDEFVYIECEPSMAWEQIPDELLFVMGPQPWTWGKIATHLLDLQNIPGFYAFEILHNFTSDEMLKEKFQEFCSGEGLEEFYNYVNRPRRTILEVLQDFPSAATELPIPYIFDVIPFMRPRAFSIASPPKEKSHIEILVAVIEYKTNLKALRKGTCSYWLGHYCEKGKPVFAYVEKGSMSFPSPSTAANIIMIGVGTGIAPFRSLIKEHEGEWLMHLFFGCRNRFKDYYFGDEFEEMEMEGKIKLYNAFSRDETGKKMDYVQDVIKRQPKIFLEKNFLRKLPAYVYVCGSSGDMPKGVYSGFKHLLDTYGCEDSDAFLNEMMQLGTYQTETY